MAVCLAHTLIAKDGEDGEGNTALAQLSKAFEAIPRVFEPAMWVLSTWKRSTGAARCTFPLLPRVRPRRSDRLY